MGNVGEDGTDAAETTGAGNGPPVDGARTGEPGETRGTGRTSRQAAARASKSRGSATKAERTAAKAGKAAAKEERRARKGAAKAERKVRKGAEKKERRARKAAAKAERRAAKLRKATATSERRALEKAIRRIAKIDRKGAKEAARLERADALSFGDGETEPREDSGASAPAGPVRPGDARAGKRSQASQKRAREMAGRAGSAAIAAGGVLEEVAGLVRQATEPAASRIVQRVTRRAGFEGEAVPVVVEPGAPDAREPEHEAAPEPTHEAAPEPEAAASEPEPEPEAAAAEPEPEPEAAAAEPEPEPEAAAAETEPTPAPATIAPGPIEDLVEPAVAPVLGTPSGVDIEPGPGAPVIVVPPGAVVGAAIDIGSTSVHLLVAAVDAHLVEPLLDESVFLGLGDRVATDGYLGAAARGSLVEVLAAYVETARHLGAADVTLIGTEPLRRAEDGPAIVHAVEARTGVALHVLDHDEEGMLTLLGVTMGRALHSELLVLDIGGGSTELVFVGESGPVRVAGLRLGAAALTRDLVRADPPTLAETGAMRAAAHGLVANAPTAAPVDVVAVGGTASNLLRLLPATTLDRMLTRRRITVALAMLAAERSADAAARHLIRPERARILPAGAIIVDAILDHYGVDRLRVSEGGMREGAILAAAKAGPTWRDRLPVLVHGWEDEAREEG